MKRICILSFTWLMLQSLAAQNFGINSTGVMPNTSAGLDVDFANKGVLIPRVAFTSLTDAVTIASPATSLLIYSKGGAVTDGYYYNSGTSGSPIWTSFITTLNNSNGCFTNWQLFTADGTFTVPAGVTKIKVCVYGGGAGGGGPTGNGSGGGGGGGGYAEGIYTVVPGSNHTVTIGIGGAGGPTGTNGGNSSFGVLISATGGLAGTLAEAGGVGGMGTGGYYNTTLGNGGYGGNSIVFPGGDGTGDGGSGGLRLPNSSGGGGGGGRGGGNGGYNGLVGFAAFANTGAGGGGGSAPGGGNSGGNGAAGKVIVSW